MESRVVNSHQLIDCINVLAADIRFKSKSFEVQRNALIYWLVIMVNFVSVQLKVFLYLSYQNILESDSSNIGLGIVVFLNIICNPNGKRWMESAKEMGSGLFEKQN